MPTISALHCCAMPGCPTLTEGRYCRSCAVVQEHARPNFSLRRLYRTQRWRHPSYGIRSQVLNEQPLCPECQQAGFITPTTDVHHTEKATAENFFDRAILQALCHAHHSQHTQRGE